MKEQNFKISDVFLELDGKKFKQVGYISLDLREALKQQYLKYMKFIPAQYSIQDVYDLAVQRGWIVVTNDKMFLVKLPDEEKQLGLFG